MAERILNLVCPNCKNGIKHDTLTGNTTSIPIEEYPKLEDTGRCWCKTCQHGTYPDEDGLCITCKDKGKLTRIQPKPTKETVAIVKELELPYKEPKQDDSMVTNKKLKEVEVEENVVKVTTKNKKSSPSSKKMV